VLNPGRLLVRPVVPADWERPGPTTKQRANDVIAAVVWFAVAYLTWWLSNQISTTKVQVWEAVIGLGVQCGVLAIRRSYPLICLLVASVLFVAVTTWQPGMSYQMSFQAAYFAALYSAASWAKDTRAFRACAVGVLLVMAVWLAISSTLFGAYEQISKELSKTDSDIPAFTAWMAYTVIMNVAFFAGALYFGRRARAGAWQRETLVQQAAQLRDQSAELARRAVVDERLRIARELHDVVAHHISAVGIQAAAARRVQSKSPQTAAGLLSQVEGSARSALAETRALLGVLRSEPESAPEPAADDMPAAAAPNGDSSSPSEANEAARAVQRTPTNRTPTNRAPEPGLADLEDLAKEMEPDVQVETKRVEAEDLPLSKVPAHLGLTLYRVAQEALTNVRRHSTARSASLTVRTGRDAEFGEWVEAEILDTGRALPTPRGPSGSGYGLEGIRERAALHQGSAEIGPRTGAPGFRVRLRLPLNRPEPTDAADPLATPQSTPEEQHEEAR
jgi:signal transduction histidine kinase